MSTTMPVLESERLIIRPFVLDDLEATHRVLCGAWDIPKDRWTQGLPRREEWLRWNIANYEALAHLDQPPYGDRAIELRAERSLIGVAGLVPAMGPFGQLPGFPAHQGSRFWYPEVGLFWSIDPVYQGKGYATEAARTLIDYALGALNLGRIIATTEYDNSASIAVMRKLGMCILRNPLPDPHWFQVVGVLNRDQRLTTTD